MYMRSFFTTALHGTIIESFDIFMFHLFGHVSPYFMENIHSSLKGLTCYYIADHKLLLAYSVACFFVWVCNKKFNFLIATQ